MSNDNILSATVKALLNFALPSATSEELETQLRQPATMSKTTYEALQKLAIWVDLEDAQGHDCMPDFDARADFIEQVMQAAPWTLHPDHGCVLKTDVGSLDEDAARELLEATKPEWASGLTRDWTTTGAQLCTRDGRVCGNAVVTGCEQINGQTVYTVVTDAGTQLRLNEKELKSMFHQPRFTMNTERHPGVLRRAGAALVHPMCGLTADQLWWQTGELRARIADLEAQQKKSTSGLTNISPAELDAHLDSILRAGGSALKHYTMAKPKEDMRAALRQAVQAFVTANA
ncbi:hypothetical protein [Rubrivivax gelatinosus]|uniref:hypothetical protein n=1 Tax=Rubrivivax gelatinosus TaxID=28068 RepID=UPI000309B0A1|nr:hypothetical protein [Rubrivivax gelatinosus]MBG6083192.1 hypothetical protein [Rubrivivax gelatinosus]